MRAPDDAQKQRPLFWPLWPFSLILQEVLDRGDVCVGPARNPSSLSFSNTTSANFLALPLDVTSKQSIDAAFDAALNKLSRVDVIVNHAGYGLVGCFEELSDEQIRQQMEVNYFGLIDVTCKVMQTMREQTPSGGLIPQVTSIGAKGACRRSVSTARPSRRSRGFTEAVSQEVKLAWGIKFKCIEPGGFRTDWSGSLEALCLTAPGMRLYRCRGEHEEPAWGHRREIHGKAPAWRMSLRSWRVRH
jgi:NAD(P)-dependent dehydrogenase (short-subunit alcohol dehydrogenase family)